LVEVLLRFVGAALPQAQESALGMGVRQLRFERAVQRDVVREISLGARPLALRLPVSGAIEPSVGKARIQLNGLVVIGERAVPIAL
jgi:hypothetical protein